MENWQRDYITQNLTELVSNTQCNTLLVTRLEEKGVLIADDTEILETLKNNKGELEQSKKLYAILKTRKDAYNILLESLNRTNQTGAAKILSDGILKERRTTRVFWRDSGMSVPEAKFNAIIRGQKGEVFSKVYLQDFSMLPKHWIVRYMNVFLADDTDLTTILCDAKFPIYIHTNNGSTFIQITVKTLTNQTLPFKVLDNVSVAYIKSLIFHKQRIAANEMRLIHDGNMLEDNNTLRDCNILNNSVINMLLRLRGGWLSTDFKAGQKGGVGLPARNQWEGYKNGINLIGECSNKSCRTQELNNGETIDRVGYCQIRLNQNNNQVSCAACKTPFTPINFLISCGKSLFRFQIRNKIESIVVESFEGHDKYKYFNPAGNSVEYDKMEIHTVAEDWSLNFCIFCEGALKNDYEYTYECQHTAHNNCAKKYARCICKAKFITAEEFKTLLQQEKPSQIITAEDEVIVEKPPDIVHTVENEGFSFRGKYLQFCLLIGFLAVILAAGKSF